MESNTRNELLKTIFRVFPGAVIVKRSAIMPGQTALTPDGPAELAKLVKPRQAVSRACKHRVLDERQLSLFNESENLVLPKNEQPSIKQSEVCQLSSPKPQIVCDIINSRALSYLISKGGGI
jgi:hypothetical protein